MVYGQYTKPAGDAAALRELRAADVKLARTFESANGVTSLTLAAASGNVDAVRVQGHAERLRELLGQ